MKNFFAIILVAGIIAFCMTFGMSAWEKEDCNRLVAQASEGYDGFYITQNEKDMCDANGITVNAPVYSECVNGVSVDVPRCQIDLE